MADLNEIKKQLKEYDGEPLTIMEVCGTHTAAISENGIAGMLSPKIRLISGPGCPVCVTVASYIDRLVELSLTPDTTVVTFGDMMRVRGSERSLRDATAMGGSVKMIYSPFEILKLAEDQPEHMFIFAAVGFETTTPVYALIIEQLIKSGIKNIRLLTALKTMPGAIREVVKLGTEVTGFLAPGHVSVITGHRLFEKMAEELGMPFVTAGFEGEELLMAIYALIKLKGGKSLNMYPSVVSYDGNTKAQETVNKYFEPCDAAWRGMGIIPGSGMKLREEYMEFDAGSAELVYDKLYNNACSCGQIISGLKSPNECPMFGKVCTPDAPQGACMVSMEGSCFHYYINKRR
ncbi:MAG: hydrogenase formation protein HypD [Oscillospiraceae bacterium]|nr:hydrogenase formation protein HypD [Oscillospiraceae bacterium]